MPGAWTNVSLSDLSLYYGTVLDGGFVKAPTGSRDAYFSFPGLTLTGWIEIEVTITPVTGSGRAPRIFVYSTPTGNPDDGFGEYLSGRYTDIYHDTGPQSLRLGPGYQDWDTALSEGDDHCYINTEYSWVSAVRWRMIDSRYDGLPPGPANDNFADSIPLIPGTPTVAVSSEFATHEPFEEPLFGLYSVRSVWYHFDSGDFSGLGRVSPKQVLRYAYTPTDPLRINAVDVFTGTTPETLSSVVAFDSTGNPADTVNAIGYAYFNIVPYTRYFVRVYSDQEDPPYTYQITLDLLTDTADFPYSEDFDPAPAITPNDLLPEQPGVWVLDYVSDVPSGQGVDQSIRIRQVNPLTPYVQGAYQIHFAPFTLTVPSKVSFWANFTNPNAVGSSPFEVAILTYGGGPTSFWVEGYDFYGAQYSAQSYYTAPGWNRYEYVIEPGEYVLRIFAAGAYSDGGYVGPASIEVTKFEVESLAFHLPPQPPTYWGVLLG